MTYKALLFSPSGLWVLQNYVSESHAMISQTSPVELINLEAGEMGQFLHYKTFACTEVSVWRDLSMTFIYEPNDKTDC